MRLKSFQAGGEQQQPDNAPSGRLKLRVLYVEDEDINWQIAAPSLRDKYNLHRAKDARDAVNLIKAEKYDCILMDIQLVNSYLDGIQLTQVLRGRYSGTLPDFARELPPWVFDVPIIFVTAYTARYSRDDLVQGSGGSELMGKPVNFVALALTISRLISARILAPKEAATNVTPK
jgi:CheY-like chemotaxis protein